MAPFRLDRISCLHDWLQKEDIIKGVESAAKSENPAQLKRAKLATRFADYVLKADLGIEIVPATDPESDDDDEE